MIQLSDTSSGLGSGFKEPASWGCSKHREMVSLTDLQQWPSMHIPTSQTTHTRSTRMQRSILKIPTQQHLPLRHSAVNTPWQSALQHRGCAPRRRLRRHITSYQIHRLQHPINGTRKVQPSKLSSTAQSDLEGLKPKASLSNALMP